MLNDFIVRNYTVLNTYKALLPFWLFKDDMFGHVKNFSHWVYLLLQDNRAIVWLRFFIAGFAAAKIQAPDKEPRVVDAIVASVQLEPVMDLFNDIKENFIGDRAVKARFFQALLPFLVETLVQPAQRYDVLFKYNFKGRFRRPTRNHKRFHCDANVLNHVVDFIRTGKGKLDYRVRISHGKKKRDWRRARTLIFLEKIWANILVCLNYCAKPSSLPYIDGP